MFGRVLVAVAQDELAGRAVETATGLAGALGAQLAVVHVVDLAVSGMAAAGPMEAGAGPVATQALVEEQEASGRALLDEIAGRLPSGVAETILRIGTPAGEVVATAREWGAELIVVGTHGRGGLERLMLGSVAEAVLRDAPCPVLVVRHGE